MLNWDRIKTIMYDFDGVMTDNRVLVSENGEESAFCNRSDGLAISEFKKLGYRQIIVSTEKNSIVVSRAHKLGIDVVNNVPDKEKAVLDFCSMNAIPLEEILFIGNDINDQKAMNIVGFRGAPKDAESEILCVADWISNKKGGYGVIRDLYRDMITQKNYGK